MNIPAEFADFSDEEQRLATYLAMSHDRYNVIPLDAELSPKDDHLLDLLTDDEILNTPAHVMVHIMRTAAQGGTQIISPRQIPSCTLLRPVDNDANQPFLHITGSDAATNTDWPGFNPSGDFPLEWTAHEPCVKSGRALAARRPARSAPLTFETQDISNPFHAAWLRAQAIVDFQSRPDVGGDAEEVARVFENLWGVPEGSLETVPSVSLAQLSPLREHAISTDSAFARSLAPIQNRRVITTVVLPSSADAFGPNRSFDWTAARVMASAKYLTTATNEHASLLDLAVGSVNSIADFMLPPRPGALLVHHPGTATSWSYEARTFAITVNRSVLQRKAPMNPTIVDQIMHAGKVIAPDVAATAYGAALKWVTTTASGQVTDVKDALVPAVMSDVRLISGRSSVGKTAGKELRNLFYTAVTDCPTNARHQFVRMVATVEEIKSRYPELWLVDEDLVNDLARHAVAFDTSLAMAMAGAAAVRGAELDEWYRSLVGMLPRNARLTRSMTVNWARLAITYILSPPDDAWTALLRAMKATTSALMTPPARIVGATPDLRHESVLAEAGLRARRVLAFHQAAYFASYDGVAMGSIVLARAADRRCRPKLAEALRLNAYCWVFRGRAMRSIRTRVMPGDAPFLPHARIRREWFAPGDTTLSTVTTMAPYLAYQAWKKGMDMRGFAFARDFPEEVEAGMVTTVLATVKFRPFRGNLPVPMRDAIDDPPAALRYFAKPERLAEDIERLIDQVDEDTYAVLKATMLEAEANEARIATELAALQPILVIGKQRDTEAEKSDDAVINMMKGTGGTSTMGDLKNGYYWLTQMDYYVAQDIQDAADTSVQMQTLFTQFFASLEEFETAVLESDYETIAEINASQDALSGF